MNKLKFLKITSLLLLLVNLILIGVIFFRPFEKKKHEGPKDYIITKLNLNEQQIERYNVLIIEHQNGRKKLNQQIRQKREELYRLLLNNTLITTTNPIEELGILQQELETLHLTHFKELKAICNENQLEQFNVLVDELARLFAQGPRRKT